MSTARERGSRSATSPSASAASPPSTTSSFTVEPGRITGFLGPNGAGKTTTLRMLLGLVAPDLGHGHDRRPALPRHPAPAGTSSARPSRPPTSTPAAPAATTCASSPTRPASAPTPGRRDARAGRHPGRGAQAGRRLLHGHAPAPRPGRRAARRPAGAAARRAGQRPRPRGHPLAAAVPAPPRRPGHAPCWSPATCSPRSSRPSTTSSSSPTAGSCSRARWPRCTASRRPSSAPPTRSPWPARCDRPGWRATVDRARTRLTAAAGDLAPIGDVALRAGLPIHELRAQPDRPRGAVLRAHRGAREPQPQPGRPACRPHRTERDAPRHTKGRRSDGRRDHRGAPQVLHHPAVVGHGDRRRSSPAPRSPCCSAAHHRVRLRRRRPGRPPIQLDPDAGAANVYTAGLRLAYLLTLAIGVMTIGSEYRHKTITTTFLATPKRVAGHGGQGRRRCWASAPCTAWSSLVGSVAVGATVLTLRGHAAVRRGRPDPGGPWR